jgi:hypothetical protein
MGKDILKLLRATFKQLHPDICHAIVTEMCTAMRRGDWARSRVEILWKIVRSPPST